MKIEYKFVDGTVTEVEVDGSLDEFMLELKKEGDDRGGEGAGAHGSPDGDDAGHQ